jgi:hypothetical protein
VKEFIYRLRKRPATVRKFFIAFAGAVATAISLGLLSDEVGKWLTVIISFLTTLGVYKVPNDGDRIPPSDTPARADVSL